MSHYPRIFALWFLVLLGMLPGGPGDPGEVRADNFVDSGSSNETTDEFKDPFEADSGREEQIIPDPLEPLNRGLFWLNDKLYFYALKPVARVSRIVPERIRVSVANFFSNITAPIRMVNSLLQFKGEAFWIELARFEINTTAGLAGLFDPAYSVFSLEEQAEDFGQTLGLYRVPAGPYIFWPFIGPSNLRDSVGLVVDYFLDPVTYATWRWTFGEWSTLQVAEGVNNLSLDKDSYEAIKRDSLDPYLFIRNAYAQRREGLIRK